MIEFLIQPLVDNISNLQKKEIFCDSNIQLFYLDKVMVILWEFLIEVVGTARFIHGWPGHNVKVIDHIQINPN